MGYSLFAPVNVLMENESRILLRGYGHEDVERNSPEPTRSIKKIKSECNLRSVPSCGNGTVRDGQPIKCGEAALKSGSSRGRPSSLFSRGMGSPSGLYL